MASPGARSSKTWKLLTANLRQANPSSCPPKTVSYKNWSEKLRELAREKTLRQESAYWESVTCPEQPSPGKPSSSLVGGQLTMPNDHSSIPNIEESCATLKASLALEDTIALLQQIPAVYNTQINDVLLTAMARAWTRCTGEPALFTSLEGHGRENLFEDFDVSRTVGWFTSIFPVRLKVPDAAGDTGNGWQPGEALKSVKEQLRQIPQRGIGYGILRYLTENSPLAKGPEPPIVFNYLGQFDQVVADSRLFRFAHESSGPWHGPKQQRRYILEINSIVNRGRLEVWWTYNRNLHSEAAIQQLADEFLTAVRELIAHCQAPHTGGRTPSDFPLARLDQSTLDRLLKEQPDLEDVYPLSPIQTLFFSANPGAAHSNFDQWHCTLQGDLNVSAFQRAWHETLRRHTMLRSTIHSEGLREPLQIVHRDVQLPWTIEDWREASSHYAERWSAFLKDDLARPLTLTQAPVMRFALVRVADNSWKFLWSVPALLLDGWSWPVVFRDASRLYADLSGNVASRLKRFAHIALISNG